MIILVKMHISTVKAARKMEAQLKGRDMLTLLDYTSEEIDYLLQTALVMKKDTKAGKLSPHTAREDTRHDFRKTFHAYKNFLRSRNGTARRTSNVHECQ